MTLVICTPNLEIHDRLEHSENVHSFRNLPPSTIKAQPLERQSGADRQCSEFETSNKLRSPLFKKILFALFKTLR